MKFSDEQIAYINTFKDITMLKGMLTPKEVEINMAISYHTTHWEIVLHYPEMVFCELRYMDKHVADNDGYVFRSGINFDIEKGEYRDKHPDELIALINYVKPLLK